MVDRIKGLGATIFVDEMPSRNEIPTLVAKITRHWAELLELDRELALELARKLPDAKIIKARQ